MGMNVKQQSSMAPKVIQTRRLTLRQPTEADVETVFGYASDPPVTRLMDWPRLTNQEQVTAYFAKCSDAWASGSEYSWILAEPGTDLAIGGIACRVRGTDADFGLRAQSSTLGFRVRNRSGLCHRSVDILAAHDTTHVGNM